MKKRVCGLLLCAVMLIGLLPAGVIPVAAAPEVGEVTNITTHFDIQNNLRVTFDGVSTAVRYVVTEGASYEYHDIHVNDESQNAGTISDIIANGEFFRYGTGGAKYPSGKVRVQAFNMYGEKIAEGYSDSFKCPYDGFIDSPDNRSYYLSPTGVFYFDPVEGAAFYTIICQYYGTHMKTQSASTRNYMDISSFAREGDNYTFTVYTFPVNDKLLPSTHTEKIKYSAETLLKGEVRVNADKSVTYGHYLQYLHAHTDVALSQQWQRYDPAVENYDEAWVDITEAEKANYPANQLRVTVSAQGHSGTVTSSDHLYNSPEEAYVATDYDGLRAVFNRRHDAGTTTYIKLGEDISASGWGLMANVGDVDLDLNGYTLSYDGTNKYLIASDYETNRDSVVTIRDSRRQEPGSSKWIDGKVVFNHNQQRYHNGGSHPYESGDYLEYCGLTTTVLTGNITVYGGTFINESHKSYNAAPRKESGQLQERVYGYQTGYGNGDGLKLYAGSFEAQRPIELQWNTEGKEFGIYGGTVRVTSDQPAVFVRPPFGYDEGSLPVLRGCRIVNASGNAQSVAIRFLPGDSSTSAEAYEAFGQCFLSATASYIDGVKQSSPFNGTVYTAGPILGPVFSDTFVLKTETELKSLEFQITEPEVGAMPDNTVTGAESDLYDVALTWQYERTPDTFRDMDPDSPFRTGLYYRAKLEIKPKDGVTITDIKGTATIGSKVPDRSGFTFYANYYLKDTYFDIYIGGTRIGRKNKGDVLGDGGSVQFYEAGEYPDAFFSKSRVLVFNNFQMIKNDFSHYENEYYGNGVAHILIEDDIAVIVHGENSIGGYYSTVNGICVGNSHYVDFYGDGSFTVDETWCDKDAMLGFGTSVSFHDSVQFTLRGRYGVRLEFDHGDTADLGLWDNAKVTCWAHQTEDDRDYPAFRVGGTVSIGGNAELICEQQDNEDAMDTWGDNFPTEYYDVKILKKGEFANSQTNPVTPYEPPVGFNMTGGVGEGECRYVSIKGKTVYATGISISPSSFTLTPDNNSRRVTATLLPSYAPAFYDDLTWESSDETVVQVSKDGNRFATLSGLKNGTATITATAPGGASGTCEVTVSGFSEVITEISSVEVTVNEPVAGDVPSYVAAVPKGAAYKIDDFNNEYFKHGVSWNYGDETSSDAIRNDDLSAFRAGETYSVIVTLVPKDPTATIFADQNHFIATVNGAQASPYPNVSRVFVIYTFTLPQDGGFLLGDVDGDGDVDAADALMALQAATGKITLTVGQTQAADVDGSGDVTAADALAILQFATGKITVFPAQQAE
ncbi:MAG: Ig-like domain-containing protein [Acutalibacteraceae bacterium]